MSETLNLPVVPMKNAVLLPGVSFPITAGRPATLRAIEAALADKDRRVFAVAQRQVNEGEPVTPDTLYTIGTIATVGSVQRSLGSVMLLLEGKSRGIATRFVTKDGRLEARGPEGREMLALDRATRVVGLHEVRKRAAGSGEGVSQFLEGVQEPGPLADLVAGYLDIAPAEKQALLETLSVEDRLRRVLLHVQRQIEVLSAQEDIQSKVKEELGGRQREMYLREQMKAIQKELGEGEGSEDESLKELRAKLDALALPEDVLKEVNREWSRLTRIGRESMESQVIRTYLETIAELPWNSRGKDHLDVKEASRILDEDHYALSDVKDRILEFLAVRQLWQTREKVERCRPRRGAGPGAQTADGRRRTGRRRHGQGSASGCPRQGQDPSLCRSSGRRQDLHCAVDRARHGPQVRADFARRRARRGGHPRAPAHLHRRHAGPHHPGHEAGRHEEPGLSPGRGGQARRLFPGRPRERAARSARPRAERQLH
jgi:ATP-dependent Lon protease